ncbi:MAG: DUF742 domain-containing protein [Acidimicrobiales bacterium]
MGLRHLLNDDEPPPGSGSPADEAPGRHGGHDDAARGGPDGSDDDEPAARFVRPFALTGGRTRNAVVDVDVAAVVCQLPSSTGVPPATGPIEREIWRLSAGRLSVAELSARLDLPLGVVRVLVGDLVDGAAVELGEMRQTGDAELLRRLIDAVRTI